MKPFLRTIMMIALAGQAFGAHSNLETRYQAARQDIDKQAEKLFLQGLDGLETKMREAGLLMEVLSVRNERERFQKDGNIAEGAKVGLPQISELAKKVEAWRNERTIALLNAYSSRLESLVATLTKENRIEDAIATESRLNAVRFILADFETKLPEPEPKPNPESPARGTAQAGRNWTSPSTKMEFVWIKALNMWVGKFEVTNGEYRNKEPNHNSGNFMNRSMNEDRQPVLFVNFQDALAYAEWLTERDSKFLGGARYRLPSEQEWTAFAQCGDGREYPWGNQWPPVSGRAGNYHGREGIAAWSKIETFNDGFPVTAPVDKLWANPWGLHGVGGNVWEACAEDSSGSTFGAWRGASWGHGQDNPDTLRCSARRAKGASIRNYNRGFRLVLSRD